MKSQNHPIHQHLGSIPATVRRTASRGIVFAVLCLAASSGRAQSVPQVTNRFDGGLGTFTFETNLTANGNNIAWSATANAGGGGGEVGGTFARNDASTFPFVGDLRASVVPLNLNQVLSFSGKLVLTNVNFNAELGVGFFESSSFSSTVTRCLALRIREPSSSGGPFRADLRTPSAPTGGTVITIPEGVPAAFSVTWQPSGVGDNSGVATLTVTTATSTNTVTRAETYPAAFDAFGLGAIVGNWTADASQIGYAYFDDLIYSVPPSGPPQILKQPTAPAVLSAGNTFRLFAVVVGDAPMSFQWKKVVGSVTNDVADATNSVLTFSPVAVTDAGTYFLQASNAFNGGTVTNSALATFTVTELPITPSVSETGGKLVIEAEHYDRNWVINNAAWLFDTNWPGYSSDGYVVPVATANRGTTWTTDPHLDYYVHFDNPGTWYVWVRGTDLGIRRLSIGLNGVVATTTDLIGNNTGAFGTPFSGAWTWCGYYGGNPANYTRLTIPGAGSYILSVYMRNAGLLVDQILLTQDAGYTPTGAEIETPAGGALRVQVATPSDAILVSGTLTNGQTLPGKGPKLVAASVVKGANPISKVEFYAGLVGSSSNKIGEATAFPWQALWTNYPIGTSVLTAVVTDSGASTATSTNGVCAILTNAYVQPYTPPLYTNDFSTTGKTFTFEKNNGVVNNGVASDFGWRSTAHAGGGAGEMGGLFYRSTDANAQFIGVPFDSPVNFYFDGLLLAGSVIFSNTTTMNGECIIGYSRLSTFGAEFGLRIAEPSSGTSEVRVSPAGGLNVPAPLDVPISFAMHWQPSMVGDGYLARTRLVTRASYGSGGIYAATQSVLHAVSSTGPASDLTGFGMGSWNANSTAGTNQTIVLADDLTYVVPRPKLRIDGTGNQVTLSWPYSVPAINLYSADSLGGTPVWTPAGAATHDTATGQFNKTETASGARLYRLQY